MPHCKSCNASIRWAVTPAGKKMPIDELPAPAGNVALLERDKAAPVAVVLDAEGNAPIPALQPSAGSPRYTSHFATCKFAAAYRRRS